MLTVRGPLAAHLQFVLGAPGADGTHDRSGVRDYSSPLCTINLLHGNPIVSRTGLVYDLRLGALKEVEERKKTNQNTQKGENISNGVFECSWTCTLVLWAGRTHASVQ